MVAFLRVLPDLDAGAYQDLADGPQSTKPPPSKLVEIGDSSGGRLACARCHGDAHSAPPSELVPRLAGQSAGYLSRTLRQFADGTRPSGFMQAVASELNDQQIRTLSLYYEAIEQPSRHRPLGGGARSVLRLGENIAKDGLPLQNAPACLYCHAETGLPTYPILWGQHQRYMEHRLRLWKSGGGYRTGQGAIMAPIAESLTDEQIEAVSLYFSRASARKAQAKRSDQ